jgi:two-component system OmpR family response regulator
MDAHCAVAIEALSPSPAGSLDAPKLASAEQTLICGGQTARVMADMTDDLDSRLRVLVVEDEPSLAEVLSRMLAFDGWQVQASRDAFGAIRAARTFRPHAVVLDIGLPDADGFEVLRAIRDADPGVCVLFLTARDAVEDRVQGIQAGADDYMTKPFSMVELSARLRGLLRRAHRVPPAADAALRVGDLTLDEDAREVWRAGRAIELTATEFELLRYLMQNPRRVISKSQILNQVWNYDFGRDAHVVELYISYLRKKIDTDLPPMIHTVRGAGYVLKPAS